MQQITTPQYFFRLASFIALTLWLMFSLPNSSRAQTAAEEQLAAQLISTANADERDALLDRNKGLVTPGLVSAIYKNGRALSDQGKYKQAMDLLTLALSVGERIADKIGIATTLRLMGNVHAGQGNYAEAFDHYQRSLKLVEELGDKLSIAGTLNNIGNVLDAQGDQRQALEYFEKSLKLASEVKHPRLMALLVNNIGLIHRVSGDAIQALEYFQRSLKLAEESKDKSAIARSLLNIGTVHSSQGNYAQALEYYEKSLNLKQELGNREDVPEVLGNMGLAYAAQENYQKALDYHQKALKLAEELGDKEVITGTLNNIGDVLEKQGNYQGALAQFRKSLERAEALGGKSYITDALGDLGHTYLALGEYQLAAEFAARSSALALEIGVQSYYWRARTIEGKAHLALNQREPARRAFLDAIATIEKLRTQVAGGVADKERFFENKVEPYYAMVDLAVREQDYFQALTFAERAKGRVLLDVLQSGKANITKAMTAKEQAEERDLNRQIIALNTQITRENLKRQPDAARLSDLQTRLEKARLAYESFETNLYAFHPELRVRRGQTPSPTLSTLGALLRDEKTALLEYVVADAGTYLFVLTRTGTESGRGEVVFKTYPLKIRAEELTTRVEQFRARLGARNLQFRAEARQLYDLLLKPAQMQLLGKTRLCIVPDQILWELPFQALQPAANRYVIEDHAVFYAPSLSVLQEVTKAPAKDLNGNSVASYRNVDTRERPQNFRELAQAVAPVSNNWELLAVGNPDLGQETVAHLQNIHRDERLNPLPETEREVRILRQLYKRTRSRVYIGSEATEQRVKAEIEECRVIHFATHGILDDRSPLYSHILLSQAAGNVAEDGLLQAWEIMKLDLKAEVVVLSACQTARGRLGAGEGVVGMSWAFFVAGSPTTVVSQWKVESSSTTELMVEFHRNLLGSTEGRKQALSRSEALRQAELKILRTPLYRHPFYWAGFVLIGDGLALG